VYEIFGIFVRGHSQWKFLDFNWEGEMDEKRIGFLLEIVMDEKLGFLSRSCDR